MHDERDEMIDRIVDELQKLPPVPADAAARVLAHVDAARRGGQQADVLDDDDVIFFPASSDEMRASPASPAQPVRPAAAGDPTRLRRRLVVSLPAALGYALAATLAGFLIRGAVPRQAGPTVASRTPAVAESLGTDPVPVTAVAASKRVLQEAPLQVQFVLDARRAKSVAVVGDFNSWDGSATPLERDSASGVWSTLVKMRPGRHVYAFLVDGTVWTLDPNAPRTKDADYGTEQSVRIVGLP